MQAITSDEGYLTQCFAPSIHVNLPETEEEFDEREIERIESKLADELIEAIKGMEYVGSI
jgi:hypothetical protein